MWPGNETTSMVQQHGSMHLVTSIYFKLHSTGSISCNSFLVSKWSGLQDYNLPLLSLSLPPSSPSPFPSLLPTLTVMSCGPPPFAGNLQVSYSSSDVNATAIYSCKGCFKMAEGEGVMNGTLKRHCAAGGQWTGPLPICEGE